MAKATCSGAAVRGPGVSIPAVMQKVINWSASRILKAANLMIQLSEIHQIIFSQANKNKYSVFLACFNNQKSTKEN